MSSVAVVKRIAAMGAELEALLVEPLERLSTAERTAAAHQWEALTRRLPAMTHRLVAALAEVPTEELGEPTLAAALSTLLRISKAEAHRRIHEAEELGPRAAVTGEALEPVLSHTAAAQRRGDIGAEHVKIIRRFFDRLPGFVDHDTSEAAEAQLAEIACGLRPEELRQAADRLAFLLDQDGQLTDGDRARRRYLDRRQAGPRRDERHPRPARSRGPRGAGRGVREMGGAGHVQPRRRGPRRWTVIRHPNRSSETVGRPGSVTTTRSRRWPERCWRPDNWAATRDYR